MVIIPPPPVIRGEVNSIVDFSSVSGITLRVTPTGKWCINYAVRVTITQFLCEISNGENTREHMIINTFHCKDRSFHSIVNTAARDTYSITSEIDEKKTENSMKMLVTRLYPEKVPHASVHWWTDCINVPLEEVRKYKNTPRRLSNAIRNTRRRCWKDLITEIEKDPCASCRRGHEPPIMPLNADTYVSSTKKK